MLDRQDNQDPEIFPGRLTLIRTTVPIETKGHFKMLPESLFGAVIFHEAKTEKSLWVLKFCRVVDEAVGKS